MHFLLIKQTKPNSLTLYKTPKVEKLRDLGIVRFLADSKKGNSKSRFKQNQLIASYINKSDARNKYLLFEFYYVEI